MLFFASFGFMQVLEIVGALSEGQADLGYIVISFTSKTFLGWMVGQRFQLKCASF
jgi:hypothetical protein